MKILTETEIQNVSGGIWGPLLRAVGSRVFGRTVTTGTLAYEAGNIPMSPTGSSTESTGVRTDGMSGMTGSL